MTEKVYEGFTPHPGQSRVIEGILNTNARYICLSVGRQWGKTTTLENIVLYWAINNAPFTILWVSPVYSQTAKVQKDIMRAIGHSDIVKACNYAENFIELKNGSEILFRSAERYDAIRGLSVDAAICDEASFIKEDAWKEAIRPTLLVRGKKAVFSSTPKGKNWFYDIFQMGMSPDYPNYLSFTGTSLESPYISQEEIEDARKTLPPNVFKQEYEAAFIDSGGEVFQNLDAITLRNWPAPQGKIYCGIDLGKQQDYTVATFMDASGKVIDIYRDNQVQWDTMVTKILALIGKYKASVLIEVNSIGDVIFEQIKKRWPDTTPFVTSSSSKQEIIEGLILDVTERNIFIPDRDLFPHLVQEMEIFTYKYSPQTRSIRYSHPDGFNDDTVMSLAIANYHRKKGKAKGVYAAYGGSASADKLTNIFR